MSPDAFDISKLARLEARARSLHASLRSALALARDAREHARSLRNNALIMFPRAFDGSVPELLATVEKDLKTLDPSTAAAQMARSIRRAAVAAEAAADTANTMQLEASRLEAEAMPLNELVQRCRRWAGVVDSLV